MTMFKGKIWAFEINVKVEGFTEQFDVLKIYIKYRKVIDIGCSAEHINYFVIRQKRISCGAGD